MMKLPKVKGYQVTSLEQMGVALLVVCLLLHFAAWASVSVGGETIYELAPFQTFGMTFTLIIGLLFILTIVLNLMGRFTGLVLLLLTHMTALVYLSTMAAKKMKDMAGFLKDFGAAFETTSSASSSISVGGIGILVGVLVFVTALCLVASWCVACYHLAVKDRKELRQGYLIGSAVYLTIAVLSLLISLLTRDSVRFAGGSGNMFDTLGPVYIMVVCAITLLIMLFMLIINFTVWVINEILRSSNPLTMRVVAIVCAVLFFLFFLGTFYAKSELKFSFPSSLDEIVLISGEYVSRWVFLTFMQAWTFVVTMTFAMRAVYFSRSAVVEASAQEEVIATIPNSEATPSIDTTPSSIPNAFSDDDENPNRKYYIGGGVVAAVAVLVAAILLLFKGCGGSTLLNAQKPSWDKFVTATESGVTLHKDADADSPLLRFAMENIESDCANAMFSWSDEGDKRGYTVTNCIFEQGQVSPVLAEKDGWYKVQINDEQIGTIEAWVQQHQCKEVKPTPITKEVLDKLGQTGWNRYHVVTNGKLENLVLHSALSEMYGYSFELGVLLDGALVCPQQHEVFISEQRQEQFAFSPEGRGYSLAFSENEMMVNDNEMEFFDPQKISDEQVQKIYDALLMKKPAQEKVYYYFPELNENTLFGFVYELTEESTKGEEPSVRSEEEDMITDYRVSGGNDEWQIEAILGEKSESTGITLASEPTFLDVKDYDQDGNKEVLVQETGEGSAGPIAPYIVYYDSAAKQYRKTAPIGIAYQTPEVVNIEGHNTLTFRHGVRWERYVFEDNKVVQTENEHKDMGSAKVTWTVNSVFGSSDELGERRLTEDLNEDGVPEEICFVHEDSHAFAFGKYMMLQGIVWSPGGAESSPGISGERFAVLSSRTNGVHDLLVDDTEYYRWNGENYAPWMWDGQKMVEVKDE